MISKRFISATIAIAAVAAAAADSARACCLGGLTSSGVYTRLTQLMEATHVCRDVPFFDDNDSCLVHQT